MVTWEEIKSVSNSTVDDAEGSADVNELTKHNTKTALRPNNPVPATLGRFEPH